MEIVSFNVAKAIKDAGYPQDYERYAYRSNGDIYMFEDTFDHIADYCCDAPEYIKVWLWLWREKKICIEIINSKITTQCYATINDEKDTILFNSPEEAIIAAIDYLVDNNLIK